MRTSVIIAVGCAVVLVGAFFASRSLVSDVPAPVGVVTVVSMPPDQNTPANLAPATAHPTLNREAAEAAMAGPRNGPLMPVNKAPSFPHVVDKGQPAPVDDVAPSPFQGESKELDYAEAILKDVDSSNERLQSAHDVLARCIQQEPDNKRCEDDLLAVNTRLFPRSTTELKPKPPTLQVQPPTQLRPGSQLR